LPAEHKEDDELEEGIAEVVFAFEGVLGELVRYIADDADP
jgi:hypothetical protein